MPENINTEGYGDDIPEEFRIFINRDAGVVLAEINTFLTFEALFSTFDDDMQMDQLSREELAQFEEFKEIAAMLKAEFVELETDEDKLNKIEELKQQYNE